MNVKGYDKHQRIRRIFIQSGGKKSWLVYLIGKNLNF